MQSTSAQWEVSHCLKNPCQCQWINDGPAKTCSRYSPNLHTNEIFEFTQLKTKTAGENAGVWVWSLWMKPLSRGRWKLWICFDLHWIYFSWPVRNISDSSDMQWWLALHIVSIKPAAVCSYRSVFCQSWCITHTVWVCESDFHQMYFSVRAALATWWSLTIMQNQN